MFRRIISVTTAFLFLCSTLTGVLPATSYAAVSSSGTLVPYLNASLPVETRVADLLGRMSNDEKIGQMVQAERASVTPEDVKAFFLGSVLSGGGSFPNGKQSDSTRGNWAELVDSYQAGALSTPLGIPILYGVDAIHGQSNLIGATLFPHNIGLGATRDIALVKQIGSVAAQEIKAAGTNWAFGPTIADPQNIKWGRTYEGFSDNQSLVGQMAAAYIQGMQGTTIGQLKNSDKVVATAKHFLGEGLTENGTNQGNVSGMTEQEVLALDLPMYKAAIDAGARTIMASYSSIQGLKMHANQRILTDVLKGTGAGQLGFTGFVITDYNGVQQVTKDWNDNPVSGLKDQIRVAINAGVDMLMEPADWQVSITYLKELVAGGQITQARIDDAVSRILRVKFESGVFEHPMTDKSLADIFGSAANRTIARQAVKESLVLLKNDKVNGQPILSQLKNMNKIFIAGKSADNIGLQSGGWSITWQGQAGNTTPGTTILQGIKNVVGDTKTVTYNKHGRGAEGNDVAIAIIGETPYAEGNGDNLNGLKLDAEDRATLKNIHDSGVPTIVILISGRPMMVNDQLSDWAGLVEAWLPGTEGQGIADVLFGADDFTGKLPVRWPFFTEAYTNPVAGKSNLEAKYTLFDYGYGLTKSQETPALPETPELPGKPPYEKVEAESFTAQSGQLQTENATDAGGGLDVGWSSKDAWLEYSINVPLSGKYNVDFRYAVGENVTTGVQILDANGKVLGTLSVGNTGGWQNWQTKTVLDVQLAAGVQKIKLLYTGGSINLNWFGSAGFTAASSQGGGGGGTVIPQPVIQKGAVANWVTTERDSKNIGWYYAPRYQEGDKLLAQQPNLDLTAVGTDNNATSITINPEMQYQSMMGIGTSIEESTVYNLIKMSSAKQEEVLKKLVSKTDGIGMSMLRLTIGSPDFTARTFYTYDDMPAGQIDTSLSHFSIQKDIDYGIISTLQKIKAINPNIKFFASPWSPPGWMKTSDSMIKGQVKDEYLPILADYFVKYIQAYKDQGIVIEALTLQNEPLLEIEYPSTKMPWQQEAELSKLLRKKLDDVNFGNVKIWIFDHNPGDTMNYPVPLLSDPANRAAVDGTAFHDYGGDLSLMTQLHDMFPDKGVYLTERAVWGTEGADEIAKYFRNWARSYNSWVGMLDSDINTHQWIGTPDPTLLIQDSSNRDNYWLTPEYYLLGQFTKFVDPDYIRIDSNYGSKDKVTNVAFMSPDKKTIVTVVINQTDKAQTFKLISDGTQIAATLPAKSVATYRWNRLAANHAAPGTIQAIDFNNASGTTDVSDGSIGNLNGSASFDYVVKVAETGTYDFDIAYVGDPKATEGVDGTSFILMQDDTMIATGPLTQNTTGGIGIPKFRTIVSLTAGVHKLTLVLQGTQVNVKDLSFAKAAHTVHALPGLIQAEDFIAASNVLVVPAGGSDGTDLSVGYVDKGDWMDYQVTVGADGDYPITYRYASSDSSNTDVQWTIGDTVLGTDTLTGSTQSSDWNNSNGTVHLTEGTHTIRLNVMDGSFNLNWIAIGQTLIATTDGAITEGNENGKTVSLQLLNDTFISSLTPSNWHIQVNGMDGISVESVTKVDDNHATVELSGNSISDFDTDAVGSVMAAVYESVIGSVYGSSTLNGLFPIIALDDPESLSVTPQTLDYNVDEQVITLNLTGGTYNQANVGAITLSGAVTSAGVSLGAVNYVNPHQVTIKLAWDNTKPYYADLLLTINVPVEAYSDSRGGGTLTENVVLTGTGFHTTAVSIPGTITANDYYQLSGVLADTTGGKLTGFGAGDWADFKINVPNEDNYALTVKVSSPNGSGFLLKSADGVTIGSFNVPNQYNSTDWIGARMSLNLKAGEQIIRIYANAGGFELKEIALENISSQTAANNGTLKMEAESFVQSGQNVIQYGSTLTNLGYLVAGTTLDYQVTIQQAGYYKVNYHYATAQGGVSVTLLAKGQTKATTSMPGTGGWGTYKDVNSVVHLDAGNQTLRLIDNGDGFNLDWFQLDPTDAVAIPVLKAESPVVMVQDVQQGDQQIITLTTNLNGAKIYYTTDGTLPTKNSILYTSVVTVTKSKVIRAITVKEGMEDSFVTQYAIATAAPKSSPGAGTYNGTIKVTLTSKTTGSDIYYTTDGNVPTTSSSLYSGPILVNATAIIKAMAIKDGMNHSDIVELMFTIVSNNNNNNPGTQPTDNSPKHKPVIEVKPVLDPSTGHATTTVAETDLNSALDSAKSVGKGVKTVSILVQELTGQSAYDIILPAANLSSSTLTSKLEVVTAIGTVLLPSNMLSASELNGSGKIVLTIAAADTTKLDAAIQAQIGNRPVIELSLKAGNSLISWNNPSAPVTVSVPYKPIAEELANKDHITVWYIDGQGNAVAVPSGRYDEKTGTITFTTTHFSQFAVVFVTRTFKDTDKISWAKQAIESMASKGVINGTSETTFAPNEKIKRADFIVLLVKALGLTAEADGNFTDVSSSAYYADAIGVAKKLGIVQGKGYNRFEPTSYITRQEMMTLAARALSVTSIELTPGSADDLAGFTDLAKVAPFALDGVATLVHNGIVVGDGTHVNPLGNATRAETAVMIYKMYNLQ
jgi:beta-glucosidase